MWKKLVPAWAKAKSSAVSAEEVELPKKVPVQPPPSAPPAEHPVLPNSTALVVTTEELIKQEIANKNRVFLLRARSRFKSASNALSQRPQLQQIATPLPGVFIGRRFNAQGDASYTCFYQPQLVVHEAVGAKPWEEEVGLRRLDGEDHIESLLSEFTSRFGVKIDPELPLLWQTL